MMLGMSLSLKVATASGLLQKKSSRRKNRYTDKFYPLPGAVVQAPTPAVTLRRQLPGHAPVCNFPAIA
jgi:hypothetical protein